jgi:hypothetical protein
MSSVIRAEGRPARFRRSRGRFDPPRARPSRLAPETVVSRSGSCQIFVPVAASRTRPIRARTIGRRVKAYISAEWFQLPTT